MIMSCARLSSNAATRHPIVNPTFPSRILPKPSLYTLLLDRFCSCSNNLTWVVSAAFFDVEILRFFPNPIFLIFVH